MRAIAIVLLCACGAPEPIADADGAAGPDGGTDAGRPDAGPDAGIPPLDPTSTPRFSDVWQIATHNSYWVQRGNTGDSFASGIEERMMDQLLFDHVRGLELDVHPDPDRPGEFGVYHTLPGNSLCPTLSGCLASLRVFAHALPEHEVVTIILELKEIADSTFDDAHTIEDLDAILERELGAALYRPGDFLARCPLNDTLGDCAAQHGWPTAEELRGRFVVAILGNWDAFGGQATRDWADYAISGDIHDRAAFPMASAWKLDWELLPAIEQERITADELDRAARQSIFLQIQSLDDRRIDPTIARHGVVRVDGAFDPALQLERIARGMQLMQTDYPWTQHDDRGPSQPFRALDPTFGPLVEPGVRFAIEGAPAFAYWRFDTPSVWEAAIASGHENARFGCLRAEAEPPALDSIEVCRTKIDADRTEGEVGDASAESVTIRVTECRASCTTSEHVAAEGSSYAWGDLLGLDIDGACVDVRVADGVDTDDAPRWQTIASPCFDAPLVRQGIARAAEAPSDRGPALFVGVRHNGEPARAADAMGTTITDSSSL